MKEAAQNEGERNAACAHERVVDASARCGWMFVTIPLSQDGNSPLRMNGGHNSSWFPSHPVEHPPVVLGGCSQMWAVLQVVYFPHHKFSLHARVSSLPS
jgi:hypothetical protein